MKLRRGFVSNSSTTSFLIYGICMDGADISKRLSDKGLIKMEEDEESYDLYECENLFPGYEITSCPDTDDYFIGPSWDSIGDDETGREFREKIEKKFKELLGDDITCSTYQEAWRDG